MNSFSHDCGSCFEIERTNARARGTLCSSMQPRFGKRACRSRLRRGRAAGFCCAFFARVYRGKRMNVVLPAPLAWQMKVAKVRPCSREVDEFVRYKQLAPALNNLAVKEFRLEKL